MANEMTDQLRDIKPLVTIDDYSIYLYWGLWIFGLIAIGLVLNFLIRKYLVSRRVNLEKMYLSKIEGIDWSDSKRGSYEATEYGRFLANDERREGVYQDMVIALEKYKYQKVTPNIEPDDMAIVELYKKVCHESF